MGTKRPSPSTSAALQEAGAAFTAALTASLEGATARERDAVSKQLLATAREIAHSTAVNTQPRESSESGANQATRAALLDSARRVFADRGYQSATVEDVAKAAGFTKGAVYSQFSSKEELFLAAIEDLQATQRPHANWLDDPVDPSSDLDPTNEVLLSLETYLHALRNPHVRDRLQPLVTRQFHELAAVVHQSWVGSGDPTQEDSDAAFVIAALYAFASIIERVLPPSFDVSGAIRRSITRLRDGLQAERNSAP